MSEQRDQSGDMARSSLDDLTAERLLAGRLDPEDAPLGWRRVAMLIDAAAGPAEAAELDGHDAVVAAMAAAILGDDEVVSLAARREGFSRFRTTRVAGIAAAVVLLGATAAAAATNSLPRPAQSAVSTAAAHVGVDLPKPTPVVPVDHDADDVPASGAATTRVPDHDPARGAASATAATVALCRADGSSRTQEPRRSEDREKLAADAATARESIADFCRGVGAQRSPESTTSTSVSTGDGHDGHDGEGSSGSGGPTATSTPSSGDHGGGGDHGQGGANTQVGGTTAVTSAPGGAPGGGNGQGGSGNQGGGQGGSGNQGGNGQGGNGQGGGNNGGGPGGSGGPGNSGHHG